MKRELAGVIACFQEIEIACGELESREGLNDQADLQKIRQAIREFFIAPSVSTSKDVQECLTQISHRNPPLVQAKVTVDGLKTSLFGLSQELQEVIDDL